MPDHYSLVAPRLLAGHGTLYRRVTPIAESRRTAKLLEALDAELASLQPPQPCIRVVAASLSTLDAAVLIDSGFDRLPAGTGFEAHPARALWVDPERMQIIEPATGERRSLAGLLASGLPRTPRLVMQMVDPSTDALADRWLDVVSRLDHQDRVQWTDDPRTPARTWLAGG